MSENQQQEINTNQINSIQQNTIDSQINKKISLTKFFNKIILSNVGYFLGFLMLILSITNKNAFSDQNKVIGNIVCSSIILILGIACHLTFTLFITFSKNVQQPRNYTLFTCLKWLGLIPFLGAILGWIWKVNERKNNILKEEKIKKMLPSSIIIIFWCIVITICVIWLIYLIHGPITYTYEENGKTITAAYNVPGILDVFLNPLKGFAGYTSSIKKDGGVNNYVEGIASLAIFLLVMGALINFVMVSKSFEAGLGRLIKKMKNKTLVLIPIVMVLLAVCGTVFGMYEETVPLYAIIVPTLIFAGFDALTGVLTILLGAGVGVAGSIVNPFVITISAEAINTATGGQTSIGMVDGIVWRIVMLVIILTIVCTLVTLYARKVRNNPTKSIVHMTKQQASEKYKFSFHETPELTGKRKATLIVFAVAFLLMIIGFIAWQKIIPSFVGFENLSTWMKTYFPFLTSVDPLGQWGVIEGCFVFFIATVIIGIINWQGHEFFMKTFTDGSKDFITVAFILAIARGLSITLTESGINDLMVQQLASGFENMHAVPITIVLYFIFAILALCIPSTSGLASALFPTVGPALLKAQNVASVTSSITVFSWGSGFINMISPTGVTMPALETIKFNYVNLIKGGWKILLIIVLSSIAMLIIGSVLPLSAKLF